MPVRVTWLGKIQRAIARCRAITNRYSRERCGCVCPVPALAVSPGLQPAVCGLVEVITVDCRQTASVGPNPSRLAGRARRRGADGPGDMARACQSRIALGGL